MRKTLKRFLTTALCSATLVAAGLGVNALTADVAKAEGEIVPLEIAAQTLNVSDNVNMVYLIPVGAGAKGDITVYVTENGVETPIYADATNATYGGNEYYRFIYRGITAYEMDTNLYAYAKMGSEKSEEVKYSVLQYAYNKLGMANGAADNSLTNLLTAMLNYGTAAANFKGNDIDLMADYTYVSVEHATFEDGYAYGLYKKGETLTVKPDFGWKFEAGASDAFSVDGETIKFTVPDEKYVDAGSFVEDNDISAQEKVNYEAGLVTFNTTAAYVGDTVALNTATSKYNEVSITWSATGATIADGVVTFDAEGAATLTATIECDGTTATKTFTVTVTVNPYPVEGKAYALKSTSKYYAVGPNSNNNGLAVSADETQALAFYFKKLADGYAIYYYKADVPTYLGAKDDNVVEFVTTEYAWTLDVDKQEITASTLARELVYNTNGSVIRAYKTTTTTDSNYHNIWFEEIREWTNEDKVAYEAKKLVTTYSTNAGTDLNLPTETEQFGATISWALAGDYDFVESFENGVLVTTNPAEDATVNVTATISLNGVNSALIPCTIAVKHIEEGGGATQTVTKDDFDTLKTDTGYSTRKTTNGWTATNAAVVKVNNDNTVVLNGKTTAVGTITSPTLSNGLSSISFYYTNTYSESKGVDLQISIKQNGAVVATKQLDNNSVTQKTVYTFTWDLAAEGINIEGDYTIEIKNNSPSKSTSNKDRVSIWNISCVSK